MFEVVRYHVRLGLNPSDRFIVLTPKSPNDLFGIWDTKRRYVVGYKAYPADAQAKCDELNAKGGRA